MPQARLRTARLELVPLADEHLPYEIELDSDPEVMRYIAPRARTADEVRQRHQIRLALAAQGDGRGLWAGFGTAGFIGLWMLMPPESLARRAEPGVAELGYRLLRRHWRRGYAREGAAELVRHGFADLELNRIFAETMAVNAASRATMASVGLRYVRTFHPELAEPVAGYEHGDVEYELHRATWLAGPSPADSS
ncbi:GNAT family N-acetyltransferase [Frankia nepalensis]|uniref:GNAT family N-acetyltransferase n=1 Tax=Frankia nepalensis TaxID=1836974 RepID=A0A937RG20_9ACTN|nr:GNAT family N-acetyltransferase [Frankia nepalensis]MBL7631536.1 GNAT family N-acetyltransferase [Frankia nepalensis]